MYFKIAVVCVLVTVCRAGLLVDDGHGQAVSSQSIIRHDQPSLSHVATLQPSASLIHSGPILQHSSPILQHSSILEHSSPLIQGLSVGHGPIVQQSLLHHTPIVQHAPIVQHSPIVQHAPIVQHVAPIALGHGHAIEEHAPAHYEFSYSVEDPHTGDHKSQHEVRNGDVVKGEYSLLQPDGSVRKVEYSADDHSGFNAIVHNSAPSVHAGPAHGPLIQPILAGHH